MGTTRRSSAVAVAAAVALSAGAALAGGALDELAAALESCRTVQDPTEQAICLTVAGQSYLAATGVGAPQRDSRAAVRQPAQDGVSEPFVGNLHADRWWIREDVDLLTDQRSAIAAIPAWEFRGQPTGARGAPALVVRCPGSEQKSPQVYIAWRTFLRLSSTRVEFRVGEVEAQAREWSLSTGNDATFADGPSTVAILGGLVLGERIVARVVPYGEDPYLAVFQPPPDSSELVSACPAVREVANQALAAPDLRTLGVRLPWRTVPTGAQLSVHWIEASQLEGQMTALEWSVRPAADCRARVSRHSGGDDVTALCKARVPAAPLALALVQTQPGTDAKLLGTQAADGRTVGEQPVRWTGREGASLTVDVTGVEVPDDARIRVFWSQGWDSAAGLEAQDWQLQVEADCVTIRHDGDGFDKLNVRCREILPAARVVVAFVVESAGQSPTLAGAVKLDARDGEPSTVRKLD